MCLKKVGDPGPAQNDPVQRIGSRIGSADLAHIGGISPLAPVSGRGLVRGGRPQTGRELSVGSRAPVRGYARVCVDMC